MKPTFFIIIPVILGIILGFYISGTATDNTSHSLLSPGMLTQNGSPIIGDSSAKITIVEFGDYQCTFCYKFHQTTLNEISTEYISTGIVKYVYRDFPLNGPDSILATEASYCAQDQNKFWEYHNSLFDNWSGERTGWVNMNSLLEFATSINLNISEFNKCLTDHIHYEKVMKNRDYARSIGIDSTPSFLVFDDKELIRIIGAQPVEKFQDALNQFN